MEIHIQKTLVNMPAPARLTARTKKSLIAETALATMEKHVPHVQMTAASAPHIAEIKYATMERPAQPAQWIAENANQQNTVVMDNATTARPVHPVRETVLYSLGVEIKSATTEKHVPHVNKTVEHASGVAMALVIMEKHVPHVHQTAENVQIQHLTQHLMNSAETKYATTEKHVPHVHQIAENASQILIINLSMILARLKNQIKLVA